MKKLAICLALAAGGIAFPAAAHDTVTPFATRGACESASAGMSNDENAWVLETFPQFFDTTGEVASFLTKAWTCDRSPTDGQWYITDHVGEVLGSQWFDRRSH